MRLGYIFLFFFILIWLVVVAERWFHLVLRLRRALAILERANNSESKECLSSSTIEVGVVAMGLSGEAVEDHIVLVGATGLIQSRNQPIHSFLLPTSVLFVSANGEDVILLSGRVGAHFFFSFLSSSFPFDGILQEKETRTMPFRPRILRILM